MLSACVVNFRQMLTIRSVTSLIWVRQLPGIAAASSRPPYQRAR